MTGLNRLLSGPAWRMSRRPASAKTRIRHEIKSRLPNEYRRKYLLEGDAVFCLLFLGAPERGFVLVFDILVTIFIFIDALLSLA